MSFFFSIRDLHMLSQQLVRLVITMTIVHVSCCTFLPQMSSPSHVVHHPHDKRDKLLICQALTCMNDQRWRSKCLRTRGLLEIEPAFLKNNKVTIAILFSMSMSPATKKLRQLNFKINLEKIWPSLPNRQLDLPRWAGYTIKFFTSWATRVHISQYIYFVSV